MSTFGGRIPQLPGLMIDRFEDDPDIRAYFLSHDHSDHQYGIDDPDLQSYIIKDSLKIYASPLTVRMLRNRRKFEELHDAFHPLPLDVPHKIVIGSSESAYPVTVTLTSAEHIVGSVMFVFERETPKFRCLYTGDFRLSKQDLKLKRCFKLHRGLKPFDAIYFDSTWCTPKNLWNIPTREEVLRYVEPLVNTHLQEDESNYICVYTMYDVGYENLLLDLARIADSAVHVTEERASLYKGFPGMTDILTTEPRNCRIHFCQKGYPSWKKSCSQVRRDYNSGRVMRLVFSYKKFIEEHKENPEQNPYVQNKKDKYLYHVCWSTHPSLAEVSDLVNYLSPDSLHANVIKGCSEKDILTTLQRGSINSKKWHVRDASEGLACGEKHKPKDGSNGNSSQSTDDSASESLIDKLRRKGCIEKRSASPSPSLDKLEATKLRRLE
ncbi:protein artemis-like [Galendromus occidentalis]|uniref:Protein artemis n=1 Tax=Galendromus occidentalis TaxID=34638 RepID=A0AAJ6QR37_9ACAR|nr:protein artemis-like [Galendromus occidentalis]